MASTFSTGNRFRRKRAAAVTRGSRPPPEGALHRRRRNKTLPRYAGGRGPENRGHREARKRHDPADAWHRGGFRADHEIAAHLADQACRSAAAGTHGEGRGAALSQSRGRGGQSGGSAATAFDRQSALCDSARGADTCLARAAHRIRPSMATGEAVPGRGRGADPLSLGRGLQAAHKCLRGRIPPARPGRAYDWRPLQRACPDQGRRLQRQRRHRRDLPLEDRQGAPCRSDRGGRGPLPGTLSRPARR